MKYEIETYKDQTIYYDEFSDCFMCEITKEDKFKITKRNKLADVRKEIDSFIKANLNFKPFKVLKYERYGGLREVVIGAIRADGTFVDTTQEGYKPLIPDYELILLKKFDQDLLDFYRDYGKRIRVLEEERERVTQELYEKLPFVDVSKYKI